MESPATNPRWKWASLDLINPDPETRFLAFRTLQDHVNIIDSNEEVLQFLIQILDLYDTNGKNYQEMSVYLLSLLNSLACGHGKSLVLWIPEIMKTVLDALSSNSPPSSILLKSCSILVSSLVNFTTDPSSDCEEETEIIIRSLSGCLLQSLLGNNDCLSMASAVCLRVLVETERWKFAPGDLVNEVCLRITGALEEKGSRTLFHIDLVCSLARQNGFMLEAYGRSLLKSAANILEDSIEEEDFGKIYRVIEMINSIMKFTDVSVLSSEVSNCIRIMIRHSSNRRSPDFESIVAKTIQIIKYTLPRLNIRTIEEEEEEEAGTNKSWISPHAITNACCCREKCVQNFDSPRARSNHSNSSREMENFPNRSSGIHIIHHSFQRENFTPRPISETRICRKGLELAYCNQNSIDEYYGDLNPNSVLSRSNFSTSSAFSSSKPPSTPKITDQPVSKISNRVSVGEDRQEISIRWRGGLKNFHKKLLQGLVISSFALSSAILVGNLIESTDLLCALTPT